MLPRMGYERADVFYLTECLFLLKFLLCCFSIFIRFSKSLSQFIQLGLANFTGSINLKLNKITFKANNQIYILICVSKGMICLRFYKKILFCGYLISFNIFLYAIISDVGMWIVRVCTNLTNAHARSSRAVCALQVTNKLLAYGSGSQQVMHA